VKTFRFAIASALGFMVTELVLTAGLLALYGEMTVPHTAFSSPALLGLDVLSFAVGVSASFFINERITVYAPRPARAQAGNLLIRWVKFQAVSWVGNTGTIAIQVLLLAAFGVFPPFGTVVGALVTYPVVYLISIRFVWRAYRVR
jgi:putative flippase GtrA